MNRILLIEDDHNLALGLTFNLRSEGYEVTHCFDAESAQDSLKIKSEFDLVVLDWMLPGQDGLEFLKQLRQVHNLLPVLLLTARDGKEDIIAGLDSGADDYLTKPFDLNVLLARIRTLLRRHSALVAQKAANTLPDEARFEHVHIDFNIQTATVRGKKSQITYKEAQILKLLWEKRNQIVTREELLQKIWGVDGYLQSRTVDNHIVQLRKILEENPKKPKSIVSIHGTGYKLVCL